MAEELKEQDIIKLLPVNRMLYMRRAPSNPVSERQQQKSRVEGGGNQTFGTGATCKINCQSGVNFIDTLQSFLVFDIAAVGNDSFFAGSALDLISGTQVNARSGKEISRIEYLNRLNYHRIKHEDPVLVEHQYNALFMANVARRGIKKAAGAAPTSAEAYLLPFYSSHDRYTLAAGVAQRVMIPMKFLSGLFGNEQMLPPHLMRGLELTLNFESYLTALVGIAHNAAPTGFTITNPYLLLDSYYVSEAVIRFLNDEFASKKHGLVVEYKDWVGMSDAIGNASSWDYEVRRSLSMNLGVFAVMCDQARTLVAAQDSFASYTFDDTTTSQWRLGSHYLPADRINGTVEHYAQMAYWANTLRTNMALGIRYQDFVGANTTATIDVVNYGAGKFCAVLSRNNVLDLSGVALSNSMQLALNATFPVPILPAPGVVLRGYAFLHHMRRVVCFLEGLTLEI